MHRILFADVNGIKLYGEMRKEMYDHCKSIMNEGLEFPFLCIIEVDWKIEFLIRKLHRFHKFQEAMIVLRTFLREGILFADEASMDNWNNMDKHILNKLKEESDGTA